MQNLLQKAYPYEPVFKKSVLKNGVRVVTESHPFTRAVSVGLFVEVGTRHEDASLGGLTHFLEHLVFKGTKRRSAFELARCLEAVGGDLNAFTTREYTCFHATSLVEHRALSLDVVFDLVTNARLTATDFRKEREVIVQEIQMAKDNVEEYILDTFLELSYAGHPLSIPILGTEKTLGDLKRSDVVEHYDRMIRGPQLVLSVAGPIDHDEIVALAQKGLGKVSGRPAIVAPTKHKPVKVRRVQEYIERPSEQVHLLVGLPSSPYTSKFRFESFVVNELMGGGVTSRFYQKIREELGLVYSVYSFLQSFVDSGLFMAYAGTSRKSAPKVLRILREELTKVRTKGLRPSELKQFKTQIKGQILLGAEDMENRMNSLAVNEMIFGEYRPIERVIEDIEKVTLDSMMDYVRKYFDPTRVSLMVMGEVPAKDVLELFKIWE